MKSPFLRLFSFFFLFWGKRGAGCALVCICLGISLVGCTPLKNRRTIETSPVTTFSQSALDAWQRGDCRESIRNFNAAIAQQPHPALYNGLGMSLLSCNQPQSATQAFEQALSLAPGSAVLHSNLGTALFVSDDILGAEKQFDAALQIDPVNPEAMVGKASVLLRRQQPEKALQLLSKIGGVEGSAPEVGYNRALAMYQMGLADDACALLELYVAQHSNDPEARNAFAVALMRLNRFQEARNQLDKAIALRPEQGIYYYNRGNVFREEKNFKSAISDYNRALAFTPDLVSAYINRGDLFFLLHEPEKACQDLEQACKRGQCERLERYRKAGRCKDSL